MNPAHSWPQAICGHLQANRAWLGTLLRGQIWANLLLMPFFSQLTSIGNRYLFHWSHRLLLTYVICTLLLGLLIFAASTVLKEFAPRVHLRVSSIVAVVVLSYLSWQVLESSFPVQMNVMSHAPWLMLLGMGLGTWRWKVGWEAFHRGLTKVCYLCAPLVVIVWAQMLTYPPMAKSSMLHVRAAEATPQAAAVPSPALPENVYIIVFDAWSYRLTLGSGEVSAKFPNLRAAAEEMCTFMNAHSPGCHTMQSMPRLIYQCNEPFALRDSQTGFTRNDQFTPTRELPNIFTQARSRGYNTAMGGFYHSYAHMLQDSVDEVYAIPCRYFGDSPTEQAEMFYLASWYRLIGDSISYDLGLPYFICSNRFRIESTSDAENYVLQVLGRQQERQFALFHMPVPHWPFCFGPTGPKPVNQLYSRRQEEQAIEQHQFTDVLIGGFLNELKASGKYENSTIVITSDHTWRLDNKMGEHNAANFTHVPMFVKFPRQHTPHVLTSQVSTSQLMRILDLAAELKFDPQALDDAVADGAYYVAVPDREINAKLRDLTDEERSEEE